MNRREILKNMVRVTGGLAVLPAWAVEWSPDTLTAYHPLFQPAEQEVLVHVVATILPEGKTADGTAISGLSVGVDKYLEKLLADCYEPEVQQNVKTQLGNLNASSQKLFQNDFGACTQEQREQLLLNFSSGENPQQKDFFRLIKSETIRGFNTSREVMTRLHYKVAPGHYYGCVDLKS